MLILLNFASYTATYIDMWNKILHNTQNHVYAFKSYLLYIAIPKVSMILQKYWLWIKHFSQTGPDSPTEPDLPDLINSTNTSQQNKFSDLHMA